ncbi:EAL domain-containing protein [Dechloromonas sp. XY25]|uniref:EAL domain-containing protein n=1 Tax=Dechloromonas hankyongensis TaxID=2908002 RepID=A0ABS9K629_9RHOO|nr:GGDEF and EAL domain-containing protein [Dechloromonas hankyongensis]MCG2578622.1 EAL domain-containing protein [Dechloromonas hankyongensis]
MSKAGSGRGRSGARNSTLHDLRTRLAASEARLRNIIERSPDAFVVVDQQGTVQFANHAAEELFAGHPSGLLGQPFGFPLTAGETTEVDIVSPQGTERISEMRVMDIDWAGQQAHVALLRDITERSHALHALQESEKRLTLAMEAAGLGFWDIDLRTDFVTCNDRLLALLGYRPGDIAPRLEAWENLTHPDDLLPTRLAFERHLRGETSGFRAECRLLAKPGRWRWVLAQGEVVERDLGGEPLRVIGVVEDIDERKAVEDRIRQVLQHDPLTELPNRSLLYELAERELASARRSRKACAFLFVDLDRFKPINDTYGHDVGDAVLREVARRLSGCVRAEDTVGRLGGDEFLAVVSHIGGVEDAATATRHILDRLGQPYHTDGLALTVLPSIGISLFPQDGDSVEDLIKNADTAMYHAKDSGRNNFQFFKAAFNERVSQSLKIESRLRNGLEQHEFVLFYQPVFDTATRTVVGAEALLRWPCTDWQPEQFIPVAETAGFMQTLGEWVLQEVCRQQREWRDRGLRMVPVSMNVSPAQFRKTGFARSVADALKREGIGAEDLWVEMTESTIMRNAEDAVTVLRELKDMHVKVALDDFGTGYSSLSYLARMPIDILKLDQSFVTDIGHKPADLAIAEGIIALGRSLGLEVVAEGIESDDDLAFVQAHHCRHGQGFHFCRPMPADEFEQWRRQRAA